MLVLVLVLGLGTLFFSASQAYADDLVTYEVEGDADAGAPDPRLAALDDAFARAAQRAVDDLVPGAVRTAKKQDLDREIVGHARLWISRFTVQKDTTTDDRRQLTVLVRVDRDKMRVRLTELSIALDPAGTAPADLPNPKARGVVILLRVVDPEATRATYGARPDKDTPGAAALATAMKAAGYVARRVAVADGGAPKGATTSDLGDVEAETLAGDAKAELALVAAVVVDPPAAVHGVATEVVLVSTRARLVDAKTHRAVGQGAASVAATGSDGAAITQAIDRALRAALADILPAPPKALAAIAPGFHGDDTPIAEAGVVLVRLPPKTPFPMVLAEQKFLLGAKGITHASLRRLSPGGWILGVTTASSIDQVASIARRSPAKDTTSSVRVVASVVEVTLTSAAP